MCPFSYRLCATDIVCLALKRSLRAASCCSVLVVNGRGGTAAVRLRLEGDDVRLGRLGLDRGDERPGAGLVEHDGVALQLPAVVEVAAAGRDALAVDAREPGAEGVAALRARSGASTSQ